MADEIDTHKLDAKTFSLAVAFVKASSGMGEDEAVMQLSRVGVTEVEEVKAPAKDTSKK